MKTWLILAVAIMLCKNIFTKIDESLVQSDCTTIMDDLCGYYKSDGNCFMPFESYCNDGDTEYTQITTKIEGCETYKSKNKCSFCTIGYYLDKATGHCIANTIKNCYIQVTATECSSCKGVTPTDDFTACSTVPCKSGCDACLNPSVHGDFCAKCTADNEIPDWRYGLCIESTPALTGCIVMNGKCHACRYGYYISRVWSTDTITCKLSTQYISTSTPTRRSISMMISDSGGFPSTNVF